MKIRVHLANNFDYFLSLIDRLYPRKKRQPKELELRILLYDFFLGAFSPMGVVSCSLPSRFVKGSTTVLGGTRFVLAIFGVVDVVVGVRCKQRPSYG